MVISHSITEKRGFSSTVALGFFDGVHAGHRAVIDAAVKAAAQKNLVPCVFTFHPGSTLPASKGGLTLLQSEGQKAEILSSLGIEEVICPDFEEFRMLTPEQFVRDFLVGVLDAKVIVCGFNYHFGKGGAAGPQTLRELCAPYGVEVLALPPVMWEEEVVSSTRIRNCVRSGDVKTAGILLGSPFTLEFQVVHGKRLGRTLDSPTMNQLFPPDFTVPRHGVYYSRAVIDGQSYAGVTNVGIKPTLGEENLTMETYILDFSGDLYGRTIPVSLLEFLRPEEKFSSLPQLAAQIQQDIEAVKTLSQQD